MNLGAFIENKNNETIENHDFVKPDKYKDKLETLHSQLPSILDDFKKYYVFYNKNPENPEYQQIFQNIKGNLNKVNTDVFTITNDVQTNIDNINKKMFQMDTLIRKEKRKNKELKRKLGIVEHKNNASTELISEYKEIYNYGYLRNWALLLSILTVIVTIGKIYMKNNNL